MKLMTVLTRQLKAPEFDFSDVVRIVSPFKVDWIVESF